MLGYRFFPAADRQQDGIFEYSRQQWGAAQAEVYLRGLHLHLEQLAARNLPWRSMPIEGGIPVYFSHYERHYVFFRELSDGKLGVLSLLHDAADIPVRLAEDLRCLGRGG